jgi:predicted nucleotidyltransferase
MRARRSSSNNFSGGSWTDREQNSVTVPDHESPGPTGAETSLEGVLHRIDADLTSAHVSFALIGGLAVSARTEPRFTRDADLAVAVGNDAQAEALVHTLRTLDYRIESVVEQKAVGRLATVRLVRGPASRAPVVDLLFASSGIETEVVTEAEVLDLLPRLSMRVATTGHLIALKVLSRDDVARPQDLVDLRALLRVATEAELDRARRALTLIAARGFHRGRNLIADLNGLLRA